MKIEVEMNIQKKKRKNKSGRLRYSDHSWRPTFEIENTLLQRTLPVLYRAYVQRHLYKEIYRQTISEHFLSIIKWRRVLRVHKHIRNNRKRTILNYIYWSILKCWHSIGLLISIELVFDYWLKVVWKKKLNGSTIFWDPFSSMKWFEIRLHHYNFNTNIG